MPRSESLPPHIQFNDDIKLIVWKPQSVLNEAMINQIVSFVRQHEHVTSQPFNRFTDTTAVEATEVTFKHVFHVALDRRLNYAGRPPVKSAFYVTNPDVARLVRIHAMVTAHSPLQVAMFEKLEAAAKWLDIPVERLTIKD